jgi:hypothetical protein
MLRNVSHSECVLELGFEVEAMAQTSGESCLKAHVSQERHTHGHLVSAAVPKQWGTMGQTGIISWAIRGPSTHKKTKSLAGDSVE